MGVPLTPTTGRFQLTCDRVYSGEKNPTGISQGFFYAPLPVLKQ